MPDNRRVDIFTLYRILQYEVLSMVLAALQNRGSEQTLVTVGITGDADFIQLGQFVTVASQKEPVN